MDPPMPRPPRVLLTASLLIAWLLFAVPADAIESGRDATVHADGDCLRLRATPSTNGAILTCLAEGTTVTVLPGTQDADGFAWRFVSVGGQTGWVVEQYLEQSTAEAPAPQPSTPTAPPAAPTGTISGLLPSTGGGALLVWGGGPLAGLLDAAGRQGCAAASLWVTDSSGAFISHVVGAPDFVNAAWNARFPGDLPVRSPYVVICGPGTASEEPPAPLPPATAASLDGDLPASGGFGLVVWSGGTADGIATAARSRGCDASSVWTNDEAGAFISYIDGAPNIVNAAWGQRFPGGAMPGDSAVVVVCRGREAPPSTGSGPLGVPGLPSGIPNLPPGPAGNQ
jgi:hypothetical protein